MAPSPGTSPAAPILPEEALRRTDLLARSLLAALPNSALAVFDADLRVRLVEGPSAERMGLRTDRIAGQPLADLLPPAVWAQLEPEFRAVLDGEPRHRIVQGVQGGHYAMSVVPVHDGTGAVVAGLGLLYDETERRNTSQELERRLAQQSLVAGLGELALRASSYDALLQAACDSVAEGLDVELAMLLEHHGDGMMEFVASVGFDADQVGTRFEMASYRDARRQNYHVAPVVIEDLRTNTTLRGRPLRAHGVVSGATVGVGEGEAAFGVLGAYSRTLRTFSPHDLDFLRAVAHVVAAAVERRRTEERLRHDGAARPADRPAQPRAAARPPRPGAAPRARAAASRSPCSSSTSTASRSSTTRSATRRATSCCSAVGRAPARECCARATPWRASAATSSPCSCEDVDDARREAIAHRRAARRRVRAGRSVDGARALRRRERRASRSPAPAAADAGGRCCATPTPPCTAPRSAAAAATSSSTRRMRARAHRRLRIEDDLRRALEPRRSCACAYQPIVRLADRRPGGRRGARALAPPERGLVPPADFIPVAEETGADRRARRAGSCARRAARSAEWQRAAPGLALRLTVNVSARQLATPGLADVVAAALADSGLPAAALGLEITESTAAGGQRRRTAADAARAPRRSACSSLLDDFGTGYSSLGYLQRLPARRAQGRPLVRRSGSGSDGRGDGAIVDGDRRDGATRSACRPSPRASRPRRSSRALRALGCDYAQGFHFARPLPPDGIAALLRLAAPELAGR